MPAPDGGEVLVGGQSAVLTDLLESLGALLPWMALMVVATTFVLLFLAFGSVVLPVKALVMNVLSLGASFGALVWIFQDGHLSGFLDFTPTGFVEATQPILVLAIIFGLSMDYEVFLMSRIREQYDLTGDNTTAVATGLQRTGGIITSAALLLLVVIGAFSLSGITFIKMIGVAMLIAVVVDATIVRILLVPGHDAAARASQLVRARTAAPVLRALRDPGVRRRAVAAGRRPRTGRRPLTRAAAGTFRAEGPALGCGQTDAAACSCGHGRAGGVTRNRSTGWVSSSEGARGERGPAGRQRGRRHELAAADAVPASLLDGVAVRAGRRHGASSDWYIPVSGSGRTIPGGTDELDGSRVVGRAVTGPSPGQPLHEPVEERRPGPSPASCGPRRPRTRRPGRSRGTPGCAPSAAATPARRCC